jgi:hypothetical protein
MHAWSEKARRELAAFEMKYKVLEELAGVFNEIHKVEENND